MSTTRRALVRALTPFLLILGLTVLAAPSQALPGTTEKTITHTVARKHHHGHHHGKHHHAHHHGHRHHISLGTRILRVAASKRGTPYRYGATGPKAFDCSGYTSWVYARVGKHLPRTSAAQAAATRHIPAKAARPGDLVFFTSGGHVYHVAIFAGHASVWHAPYTGQVVHREHIWTKSRFFGRVR